MISLILNILVQYAKIYNTWVATTDKEHQSLEDLTQNRKKNFTIFHHGTLMKDNSNKILKVFLNLKMLFLLSKLQFHFHASDAIKIFVAEFMKQFDQKNMLFSKILENNRSALFYF